MSTFKGLPSYVFNNNCKICIRKFKSVSLSNYTGIQGNITEEFSILSGLGFFDSDLCCFLVRNVSRTKPYIEIKNSTAFIFD